MEGAWKFHSPGLAVAYSVLTFVCKPSSSVVLHCFMPLYHTLVGTLFRNEVELHHSDFCCVLTQMYNSLCWKSPWWLSYECFCLPPGHHCSSVSFNFWLYHYDHCHALTLTFSNSPQWQSSESCNKFLVLPLATIAHSTLLSFSAVITWHEH